MSCTARRWFLFCFINIFRFWYVIICCNKHFVKLKTITPPKKTGVKLQPYLEPTLFNRYFRVSSI